MENAAYVKVPFAFQAGDTLMPAGTYLFEMPGMGGAASGSMLRIVSSDGSLCQSLFSRNISGTTVDNIWQISFAKYGDTYFLAKVRNGNVGAEITKATSEKKLAAEFLRSRKAIATVELQQAIHSRAK